MKAVVFSVACLGYCMYRFIEMREKEKKFEVFRKSMEAYRESMKHENIKIKENIKILDAARVSINQKPRFKDSKAQEAPQESCSKLQ